MQIIYSLLIWAAEHGHANVVQCLVIAGANLEVPGFVSSDVSSHVVWAYVDV